MDRCVQTANDSGNLFFLFFFFLICLVCLRGLNRIYGVFSILDFFFLIYEVMCEDSRAAGGAYWGSLNKYEKKKTLSGELCGTGIRKFSLPGRIVSALTV